MKIYKHAGDLIEKKLILELDGSQHVEQEEYDPVMRPASFLIDSQYISCRS